MRQANQRVRRGVRAQIQAAVHFTYFQENIMADFDQKKLDISTGAQIAAIEAAAVAENAINLATLMAKVNTMGLKSAKDIIQ
jgi:hypothetical protein